MSSLAWIDFDEAERQRAQRIMALFQERETRDELGLGAIPTLTTGAACLPIASNATYRPSWTNTHITSSMPKVPAPAQPKTAQSVSLAPWPRPSLSARRRSTSMTCRSMERSSPSASSRCADALRCGSPLQQCHRRPGQWPGRTRGNAGFRARHLTHPIRLKPEGGAAHLASLRSRSLRCCSPDQAANGYARLS